MKKSKETLQRPRAKLLGADSNIFNLLGIATAALRKAKRDDAIAEMNDRVLKSSSFDEALAIICEYVEPH